MAYTAIDDPTLYFRIKLYEGNETNDTAITWDETDTSMQPDLLWFKSRDNTQGNAFFDAVRGASLRLITNEAGAEGTEATNLDSFDSNGFTVDNEAIVNHDSMVCWGWKAGAGSGSSNTDGSINTASTSVSTTAGFSISTYTGTGSAATVGHGLGAKPGMILIKRRDASATWHVYHETLTADKMVELDTNIAEKDTAGFMNDTEPTSSVFTVNTYDEVNASSGTHVAYCFAPKQGFSKFGSFTGNGNADGPFVYTGFRPAFILYKNTARDISWLIHDNKRLGYNPDNDEQHSDTNAADGTDDRADILSNGFKVRESSTLLNTSGELVMYAAFAEAPFVNSNGVPCNAR